MAYTKVFAIRRRLDDRIDYVVNGEKTALDAGITYATNPEKTEQHFFTSAINCGSCETAYAEMQETKQRFGRLGGVVGYHFIQSFVPGEVTPEQAHAIGVAFAQRLFGDRYEVVVGTHLDKAHLHNHVVVNSVSFVDGKKYHSSPGSYYFDVRSTSDALCRENDLSVIAPQGKGKHYAEWKAENAGKPTIRSVVRADIDSIIAEAYTYVDTMSEGIRYHKNDVVIEFFKDAGCTDKIATWTEDSGKFTVTYDDVQNTMTIKMTETGLSEINEATTVYTDSVKRGYSDCTMRITYAATLTADAQMGDKDNPNNVTLTWKRTNTTYYDTLEDCCHVYTYGVDILKQFSDGKGSIQNVKFNLHNDTDDCYIIAEQKDGVYYTKGFTSKKSDATNFIPNAQGHIIVKGLEDDSYSLTETATDKGYVLLKEAVKIIIKTSENGQCEECGAKLLTASATVNGKDVTMTDGNAIVPMTVVNNPGFDLPKTGGRGVWMYTVGGVLLLGAAAFIVIRSRKQHKSEQ